MAKSSASTGAPTEYDEGDAAAIEAELDDAWADYEGAQQAMGEGGYGDEGGPAGTGQVERNEPTRLLVTADVEWAGTYNPRPHRTLKAENVDVAALGPALRRVRRAKAAAGQAREYTRWNATGWRGRLTQLMDSGRVGQEAAARAGLTPTAATVRSWYAGEREPSRRYREAIDEAHDYARRREVIRTGDDVKAARRALVTRLSAVVGAAYSGADIRFFNVSDIVIRD